MRNTLRGLLYLAFLAAAVTCSYKAHAQLATGWGEPAKALPRAAPIPLPTAQSSVPRLTYLAPAPELFPKTLAERAWVASSVTWLNIPLDATRPKDVEYDVSFHFGGWTDHDRPGKCVRGGKLCVEYENRNPIVGIAVWYGNVAGGRAFAEVARVLTNSLGGETDWAMIGVKWKLHRGRYVDVCGALGFTYAKARLPFSVPGLDSSQSKKGLGGYACLERGPWAIRFTPITKKDWTTNLVYSFDLD